jgi:hypothetical protein
MTFLKDRTIVRLTAIAAKTSAIAVTYGSLPYRMAVFTTEFKVDFSEKSL